MNINAGAGRPAGPLRILLVKPHLPLLVARRLLDFLHLEPLELEMVAGAAPPGDAVAILDLTVERKPMEAFHRRLAEARPHIVGFTGYSNQADLVKEMARLVKEADPATLVIAGGIHATIMPADYAGGAIDLIVRGEGGTAFREIMRRFKAGEELNFGDAVLSPADPDFAAKCGQHPPAFPDVKDIPRPRRDLVDRTRYFSAWTHAPERGRLSTMFPRIASVRSSYGCAFRCAFCMVPLVMNRRYAERAPEDVVNEIAGIPEEHVYFVDDETFLNERRMTDVANLLIARGIRKKYVSWARADTIVKRPDLFRLWKEAGLSIVYVGLEAMDERRLKNYEKRTTVETNDKAVAILREIGITLHASLMVDPDFSVEDFRSVERVIKQLTPAEMSFTVFSPSPGSPLWHRHKDSFITDTPLKFYDCMHTLMPTKMDLKRFYVHFGLLYRLSWSHNPLRVNKVKVPFREILRAIVDGTRYIFALRAIHRDYPTPARR